jgi:hypothetical protein
MTIEKEIRNADNLFHTKWHIRFDDHGQSLTAETAACSRLLIPYSRKLLLSCECRATRVNLIVLCLLDHQNERQKIDMLCGHSL